ncbi:MAG: group 1 glycosyl transferase [Haloplasmataceae bacterium]|jgi:glycosyltransferase involved in cell wall biosynthesis|nr:group 1 glycosyl transferase [Haloplasmataceae bacterium]
MLTALFNDTFIPNMNSSTVIVKNYAYWLNKKYGGSLVVTPNDINYLDNEEFEVLRYKNIKIISNLADYNINLIHAHSPFNSGIIALKYAKEKHIPIVATFHNKYYEEYFLKFDFLAKLKVKKLINFYNRVDLLFVPNNLALDTLTTFGFKGKAEIIENGTDFIYNEVNNREYVNHKHEINDETRVLLYVGKITWQKNLKLLLETLVNLRKLKQDFRMFFVGDGNARDEMIKLVNENKLNKYVIFTGVIYDRNLLRKYYERADLLLFPSVKDISNQAVIEAAGFKIPSLLVKDKFLSGNIKDYFNGYLSENNGLSYAQKIIASLNDKNKITVGHTAHETLAKSYEQIVDILYQKYCEVISSFK